MGAAPLRYVVAAGRVGLVCLIGLCSVASPGVASPGVASPAFSGTERPLIAIDVGHSRSRPGAISARGEPEFAFNRGLALVVERMLRDRGFRTRLIGEQGDIEKLSDRSAAAASADAAFFLSLHHDSVQPQYLAPWQVDGREQRYSDRFSGFSLFVSRSNSDAGESLDCARAIGERLRASGYIPSPHHAEPIQGENRPWADASNGVYYYDDLVVLRRRPCRRSWSKRGSSSIVGTKSCWPRRARESAWRRQSPRGCGAAWAGVRHEAERVHRRAT